MSYISVQGEQSETDEIELLSNLTNLANSASGEFIRKISSTTFENATPPGGATFLEESLNLSDLDDVATARTNLGLVAGGVGDIWVEKAGDTMVGALVLSTGKTAVGGTLTPNTIPKATG